MDRVDKENYYLDIAQSVLERSTCLRRKYGAIIVRNDEIVSTGYNGAPRGRKNCVDLGRCTREELQVPSGQRYELCRSVHAEANAIISAARRDIHGRYPLSGRAGRQDRRADSTMPPPAPCVAAWSSMRASSRVVARDTETRLHRWWTWRTGSGRTTPFPWAKKANKSTKAAGSEIRRLIHFNMRMRSGAEDLRDHSFARSSRMSRRRASTATRTAEPVSSFSIWSSPAFSRS